MTVLGIVVFVVALLASITLHEAGHLLTAKRFGMKATQFFVGFGPTLWSRQKGETEYGVKALPLGGFCKILGMTPLEDEDIDPAERHRAFYRQSGPRRAVVLSAGSFTHFLIAFLLLLVVGMGLGLPKTTTTVDKVGACVPKSPTAGCEQSPKAPASPASKAGLQAGDKIVAFGGQPIDGWEELSAAISGKKPGQGVTMTVVRDGQRVTLRPTLAAAPDGKGAFLGVFPGERTDHLGPIDAVGYAGTSMGTMVVATGKALAALPRTLTNLFSEDRGSNPAGTVTSVVGVAAIAGQVADADVSWSDRLRVLLMIVISVNVFVGLFNMLPLLPLDGGHLAIVGYERTKARLARWRGRPEPGPVDMRKLMPATAVVFVLLVSLGLLLIVADIVNPLELQ